MLKIQTKKDVWKIFRTLLELVFLAGLAYLLINALFVSKDYTPYQQQEDVEIAADTSPGFVAISYFGVDRQSTPTLISIERLEQHLQGLRDNGYVTITQQDVLDFYQKGKPLPQKAMLLIFEDGRTDTAIFSEPILEKMNYKATACTYAEKFETTDSKFLSPKDLLDLEKHTYWELGTNGYRLAYINVFDRYRNFFGQMTSWEFIEVARYLGREYNHYLMDYIRDKDYLPVESYSAMARRISSDYTLMRQVYEREIGKVPQLYILMHSNSDRFGNNPRVSAVNEACMTETFPMNINREGYSWNHDGLSMYDLTRMQGQSYWYTNHLLMRLWDDLSGRNKSDITFVDGDLKRKASWETPMGASEFQEDRIILTSLPKDQGRMRLKTPINADNAHISVELTGNKLGLQTLYLGTDEDCSSGLAISVVGDRMLVSDGKIDVRILEDSTIILPPAIAEVELDKLAGVHYLSVEEDERDSLTAAYGARARYASNLSDSLAYANERNNIAGQEVNSVDMGAEPYIPTIEINTPGKRQLDITLENQTLTILVDGRLAIDHLPVEAARGNNIFLGSLWAGQGFSQRNLVDDVYDAVFEKMYITAADNPNILFYDNRLHGWPLVKNRAKFVFDRVLDWFIINL